MLVWDYLCLMEFLVDHTFFFFRHIEESLIFLFLYFEIYDVGCLTEIRNSLFFPIFNGFWALQVRRFVSHLTRVNGIDPLVKHHVESRNDDSIKWKHLLALCAGNSLVTGEFPSQRPVTRSFMFSLICAWTNGRVNNRDDGHLRRRRAHYDGTVMGNVSDILWIFSIKTS